jgi:hypothetical protein
VNPILLAQLLSSLGTVGLPLIEKIVADIQAGRTATTVTPADIAELDRLAKQSAAAIFERAGVMPPLAAGS